MRDFVLIGTRLVTAELDVTDAWVEVRAGRVHAVGGDEYDSAASTPRFDGRGLLLVPGLVDLHQHGGGGGAYTAGEASTTTAVEFHRSRGTTSSLASLVSAPVEVLVEQVTALVPLVEAGLLAGIHLEGPWLSPRRRGAHTSDALAVPTRQDVEAVLAAGRGCIRMVTLAPELPGADAAIGLLCDAGVLVAVGHTDASFEQTQAALRMGARVGTHLFNAMRPLRHRDPGPVLALLESQAAVELIADGVHLHPRVVADTMAVVGAGRAVLVTDAMAAAGMPDGTYRLGDREVTVSDGVATDAEGSIAGSTAALADALRFAVQRAGVPLQAAVAAATRTPARLLGLSDRGDIAPGTVADLVLLTEDLEVCAVLHAGEWVGQPPQMSSTSLPAD